MSYGAVYRIVETENLDNRTWSSRPYGTRAAANNQAARLNNEAEFRSKEYGHSPRKYVVEVLEGDWERADG